MTRPNKLRRRNPPPGFTLVEILVVFLILALLVGILVPAIGSALRAGKRAAVKAEISQLAAALESFKTKYGDYPPSRIYLSERGNYPTTNTRSVNTVFALGSNVPIVDVTIGQLAQRSMATLRKFFPKVVLNANSNVFAPGSTEWYDFNGNGVNDGDYILQGHESLVFFLGGVPQQTENGFVMTGFGANPANPFTNNIVGNSMYGANRQAPFFEFAPSRLILDPQNPTFPVNSARTVVFGVPGYFDALGASPPEVGGLSLSILGSGAFRRLDGISRFNYYAYFSTTGLGRNYDPNDMNCRITEGDVSLWYNALQSGGVMSPGPNPYTSGPTGLTTPSGSANPSVNFLNAQSFQIFSAGLDGLYGVGGIYSPPPAKTALPADQNATQFLAVPFFNSNIEPVDISTVRNRERDNIANFGAASQLD